MGFSSAVHCLGVYDPGSTPAARVAGVGGIYTGRHNTRFEIYPTLVRVRGPMGWLCVLSSVWVPVLSCLSLSPVLAGYKMELCLPVLRSLSEERGFGES